MKHTCILSIVVVVVVVTLGPEFAASVSAQQCAVDVVVLNRERRVTGDISAECGGVHDPPFGNWGARLTNFGGSKQRDRFQFSGWKSKEGWLQWNSCTTKAEYPRGDRRYYNDASSGFEEQVAWPTVTNVVHSHQRYRLGGRGESCRDAFSNVGVIIGSVSMVLYELDPWSRDDRVARLSYGSVAARVTCAGDDEWWCSGETGWLRPVSGNQHVDAEINVVVYAYRDGQE